jgi:hypothetical protein
LSPVLGGREVDIGYRRVKMVQKCVHTYVNAKITPVKTIPGMGGG